MEREYFNRFAPFSYCTNEYVCSVGTTNLTGSLRTCLPSICGHLTRLTFGLDGLAVTQLTKIGEAECSRLEILVVNLKQESQHNEILRSMMLQVYDKLKKYLRSYKAYKNY